MFLLVPAYPAGQRTIKQLCMCVCVVYNFTASRLGLYELPSCHECTQHCASASQCDVVLKNVMICLAGDWAGREPE